MNITEEQLKEVLEVVYKTKETADRLEANWDKDRKDFAEFSNRLAHLEAEFKSLREEVFALPQDTKQKVQDALKVVTSEAHDLNEKMSHIKQVTIIKETLGKKKWWKFGRR